MIDYIILILALIGVAVGIFKYIKSFKNQNGCSSNCNSCSGCSLKSNLVTPEKDIKNKKL